MKNNIDEIVLQLAKKPQQAKMTGNLSDNQNNRQNNLANKVIVALQPGNRNC